MPITHSVVKVPGQQLHAVADWNANHVGTLDHTADLTNVGVNTHIQIDTHIAANQANSHGGDQNLLTTSEPTFAKLTVDSITINNDDFSSTTGAFDFLDTIDMNDNDLQNVDDADIDKLVVSETVICGKYINAGGGTRDVDYQFTGDHTSGQGLAKFEGDTGEHAFISLEAPTGKGSGFIFRYAGVSEGYWTYASGTPGYCAWYDYTLASYPIRMYDDGKVRFSTIYNRAIGGVNHLLSIDNAGYIGLAPSSIRYKKNVRDLTDTEFIYDLRPVLFDSKTDLDVKNEMGLIAEEVDLINKKIVIYQQEDIIKKVYEPSYDKEVDMVVDHTLTTIPQGVAYEKLIVPMLKEIQKLKARIEVLESH